MLLLSVATSNVEAIVIECAWLLVAASVIGVVSYKIGVPYAVSLVIAGLIAGFVAPEWLPTVDPEVVLFVFLPPLLFDAAFRIDEQVLKRLVRPVLFLAIIGTLVTGLFVGAVLNMAIGLPLAVALLVGAIVASTDPVAVVAIVQKLGLPHQLAIVLEGESLINDGVAMVLYTLFTGMVLTGGLEGTNPVLLFAQEVGVGVGVGVVLAFAAARLTARVSDHLVEMLITVALAYGSYLLADAFHGSGPLAAVTAGVIHGSYGRRFGMSQETSDTLDDLWEFLGFIANAMLFLMVGYTAKIFDIAQDRWPALVAVVAVLLARVIVVQLGGFASRAVGAPVPQNELGLFMWSGLRGALTVALALGVPDTVPERTLIVDMAFAVVLFTLIVQGLTLPWVVRKLNIKDRWDHAPTSA